MKLIKNLFCKSSSRVILNLHEALDCQKWFPLTDQLRFKEKGSTAHMDFDSDLGVGTFSGQLNINQGAGFASYRIRKTLDLTGFKKIEIFVDGDGRRYKVLIKDENSLQNDTEYSYQIEFKTKKGEFKKQCLHLKDFRAVRRGREIFNVNPLDLSQIVELGLQINDKTVGPYQLKFKNWIAKS